MGVSMVALTPSLPKFEFKLWHKIKSAYETAINLETAYIYDYDYQNVFIAQLERKVLFEYFDKYCRYVPDIDYSKQISAFLGGLSTGMFGYLVGYFLGNIVTSVLFAFLFSFIGIPLGFFLLSPLIARKPIWLVAKNKGNLSAIVHSRIGSHEVDSKAVTPEIIFHIMEGKDAEEIFRGRMSNYQKIAIGTLVVLAVSCLIALFLFVGAFGTGG